jgi:trk system potassium uptake protein TrkH
MNKINYKIIFQMMGVLMLFNGGFMLLSALVGFIYKDSANKEITIAGLVTIGIGILLRFITKNFTKQIKKKEGYLIVTLGWIFLSLTGTLPYLFTQTIPYFTNAFFETMSGYTTTGASVLSDIESLPKGILFWRSMTHWIGGMGIIVLAIAILPLLGIGGMQLFAAEAPGPSADKLHPRITDTAKRLWFIYLGLTILQTVLLKVAGMSIFDAINHAMCTLSTGGFSTKNASVAYWNNQPIIQYIIIAFMFIAGTNFVLSYFALKGNFSKVIHNEEFKYYSILVISATIITAVIVYFYANVTVNPTDIQRIAHPKVLGEAESSFRHALFQVVAIITTTGFVTADFTIWTPFLTVLFFTLMFFGASAGSTAGGVKIVRHIIMIKNSFLEFKRTIHPHAIIPVRFNNKSVAKEIVFNIMAFFILYMVTFGLGAAVFSLLGLDFMTSVGTAASSLGNVGPSLGALSPVNNYNSLPDLGKWWSAFLMLLGRLELFTVLIILTPYFWRSN